MIIRLAAPHTTLSHVDIDTSHFSGNECPASQVFALQLDEKDIAGKKVKLSSTDKRWVELLPEVTLGPNSRHIFQLGKTASEGSWSAVMVRMIPDGGMVSFNHSMTDLRPGSEHMGTPSLPHLTTPCPPLR